MRAPISGVMDVESLLGVKKQTNKPKKIKLTSEKKRLN